MGCVGLQLSEQAGGQDREDSGMVLKGSSGTHMVLATNLLPKATKAALLEQLI